MDLPKTQVPEAVELPQEKRFEKASNPCNSADCCVRSP